MVLHGIPAQSAMQYPVMAQVWIVTAHRFVGGHFALPLTMRSEIGDPTTTLPTGRNSGRNIRHNYLILSNFPAISLAAGRRFARLQRGKGGLGWNGAGRPGGKGWPLPGYQSSRDV
jgi:hypothetical protein